MPKVWNIGNTTVRNPKRIENALTVFLEEGFSGNLKSKERQAALINKFSDRQVIDYGDIKLEDKELNGRKWRAAFYQLGFISFERYKIKEESKTTEELFSAISLSDIVNPYQITPTGRKLITSSKVPEIEDIYLRQYTCYELPNSLEGEFPNGKMKPFILFLEVLTILQNLDTDGLNKFETGLFLQKFQNHTDSLADEIVDQILEYRERISNCQNAKQIKAVKNICLEELRVFAGIDPNSVVRDYSDTTFRYFTLSGLFTRIGDTIIIKPNKRDFVNKLLESQPQFLFNYNPVEYFNQFYHNNYEIPTDIKDFALHEIELLKTGIRDKTNSLLKQANELTPESDLEIIKDLRFKLIEYNNWEREEDFANEQQSNDAINDILKYLKLLNNEPVADSPEIDDRPAYLEWAVWRSFLAIDEIISPIHQTRRFPLDHDFNPRNTAPGGGSDLLFEFNTYILVVEVSLTTSHRQMAVESEPVRRHTVQYKQIFPDKDVYCLFIAPSVDNNVAETFRIGVWYNEDNEEFVNIIPMNLSDFIYAIETFLHNRFRNDHFKNLLDRCLVFRNVRAPQWKQNISREVSEWKRRLIAI